MPQKAALKYREKKVTQNEKLAHTHTNILDTHTQAYIRSKHTSRKGKERKSKSGGGKAVGEGNTSDKYTHKQKKCGRKD